MISASNSGAGGSSSGSGSGSGSSSNHNPAQTTATATGSTSAAIAAAIAIAANNTKTKAALSKGRGNSSRSTMALSKYFIYFLILLIPVFLAWLLAPLYSGTEYNESYKSLDDPLQYDISVVIPCYNEEERLSKMVDPALTFLKSWSSTSNRSYEIIFVDDGSEDKTSEVMLGYMRQSFSNIRTIKEPVNVGKGAALRSGVLASRGRYVLIADGDGATEFSQLAQLWDSLRTIQAKEGTPSSSSSSSSSMSSMSRSKVDSKGNLDFESSKHGFVLGSRAHMQESSVSTRAWYRTLLMKGFHLLVRMLITNNIKDTQCGFKLFSRSSAEVLFNNLHLNRWAFDIELVYVAEQLGIPMAEVDVKWTEVEGSKLIRNKFDVVKTSLTMARDMFAVRFAYSVGFWKIKRNI